MALSVEQIIDLLGLQPLPGEGGFYAETHRGAEIIPGGALPGRYGGQERTFGTAIYYLLTGDADSFSALHRLRGEEIYHFYLGDSVEMLLLLADGTSRQVRLGPDLTAGERVQFVVPAGDWQGSRLEPGGGYALLGTTMAPGFDPADFELGMRAELVEQYPAEAERIRSLTRA
jgi:predicted cupin superfamily sugar epimerase